MLAEYIAIYGYAALFIGTLLEGETILIIAGIAASQGLLEIQQTILVAFAGTMLGDSAYFLIGKERSEWLLSKFPRWRSNMERILAKLERHSIWLILTFRFMYGVRNIASFTIGASPTPTWFFLCWNAVGAAVWAIAFGMGGYLFGEVLLKRVHDVKHYQIHFLIGVTLIALIFWLVRLLIRRRKARKKAAGLMEKGE